jgi:hypothetical protein
VAAGAGAPNRTLPIVHQTNAVAIGAMSHFARVEKRSNLITLSRLLVAVLVLLIGGVGAAALLSRHSPVVAGLTPREGSPARELDEAIGATVEPLDPATARSLGLRPATRGIVVTSVANGGPAVRAGVRTGDVIIAVDRPVGSIKDLKAGLQMNNVLTVTLNRHGQSVIVPLTVGSPGAERELFEKEWR